MDYTGKLCLINDNDDLYMDYDSREFIGQRCIVLKQTKQGLIQVCLEKDKKKVMSFKKKNIDYI